MAKPLLPDELWECIKLLLPEPKPRNSDGSAFPDGNRSTTARPSPGSSSS